MTETEQNHPLIAPLLAVIREVRADKAAYELTAARRVTNTTVTLVREAAEQARECSNRIWDLQELLKARLAEVRAQPAPELPDPTILALEDAIRATEVVVADRQRGRSRALGKLAMPQHRGDATLSAEADAASADVATAERELSDLRHALEDTKAAIVLAKNAANTEAHQARIAAVREINNRDCVLVGQFAELWAQVQTLLAERAGLQQEAATLYAAAIDPLAGPRFTTSPALALGVNRIGLLDTLEAAIKAHEHDGATPLEAARRHADRVSDVLDEEFARLTGETSHE